MNSSVNQVVPIILVVGYHTMDSAMMVNRVLDVQELWVRCHEECCPSLGCDWKLWGLEMNLQGRTRMESFSLGIIPETAFRSLLRGSGWCQTAEKTIGHLLVLP